jgi:hypothetical protein
MLPREHGAYSQMALPIVTALVIAGPTPAGVLLAVAVVCGFLAHEPLLLLLGGRGARARRATQTRATVWFTTTFGAMAFAGAAAYHLTPAAFRWSFLLPLVPAVWVCANALTKQEDRASTPICLVAGLGTLTAASVGFVFASVYVTGVLCVRSIVLGKRGGGNPARSRSTRRALLAVEVVSAAAMSIAAIRGWVPWPLMLALTPGLFAPMALTMRPSPPTLKTVGWSLALASAAAALILIGTVHQFS